MVERPGRLSFQYPPSQIAAGEILAAVRAAGLEIGEVTTRETELEDIFLQLTNEPDADVGADAEPVAPLPIADAGGRIDP